MSATPDLIFVWGAEATGTRLVRRIIAANGYRGTGGAGHEEMWGNQSESFCLPVCQKGEKAVWRFSFPMGHYMPNPDELLDLAHDLGWNPAVVITHRSSSAQRPASQGHKRSNNTTLKAYRSIYSALADRSIPVWQLNYEELILRGLPALNVCPWLTSVAVLPGGISIQDGNAKYYD